MHAARLSLTHQQMVRASLEAWMAPAGINVGRVKRYCKNMALAQE